MLLSKTIAARVLSFSPVLTKPKSILCSSSFYSLNSPKPQPDIVQFDPKEVVSSFKVWFKTRDDYLLDRIFEILASKEDNSSSYLVTSFEFELNQLGLRLDEAFVLKVLKHGKNVLSCLKFFDWAGRQTGYSHTRATFNAIFKILSREKLMSLILDFLENYKLHRYVHRVRFHHTLVVGYAVAGKPDIALKLFGTMRFQGLDLDTFSYHVFLNALVEQSCFDIVDVIFKQIKSRGLENEITWCLKIKSFCKQDKLKEAIHYARGLEIEGHKINDHMVSILVDAHCKRNRFEEAYQLLDDFSASGKKSYGIWSHYLCKVGKLDEALNLFRSKKVSEGFVPPVFRYNTLICKLLSENRLEDTSDLLQEMMEENISPDNMTMNAALCFFCKAGMVDVALELYNSRSEFGLSPNSLSYNYLINTLCGDGSIDEAYRVLKDSITQGYYPRKKAVSFLADSLCREGKLDKVKELVVMGLEQNIMPSDAVCIKFISALCKARRVEDGYLVHNKLSRMTKLTRRSTYFDLVRGFNSVNRGDMAARLVIEMQEIGHKATRGLYRAVICCICTMNNPEIQFFNLLKMQLSRQDPSCEAYNFFIDGAGHAKRPDLARQVFEMMGRNGIEPTNATKIFMLQSYLKSDRIADAIYFYNYLCEKGTPGRKINNSIVVGLSKANKPGLGLELLKGLREKKFIPSQECYEELVKSFCSVKNYDKVVEVIDELIKAGRPVSSFIGNTLLFHALKSRELYQAWVRSGLVTREASPSDCVTLVELVGFFSGGFRMNVHIEDLDEVIGQYFPLDIFTYNILLKRLSMTNSLDRFIELFHKMSKRGYQYNKWTYDIIIHTLWKHGRTNEAMRWVEEARRMDFDMTEQTKECI